MSNLEHLVGVNRELLRLDPCFAQVCSIKRSAKWALSLTATIQPTT